MIPTSLRTEYLVNPLGIDTPAPRFSWKAGDEHGVFRQTAWQVIVASDTELISRNHADMWDSAKEFSGKSVNIPYKGKILKSRTRYWWKVRTADAQGNFGPYSEMAWFETGLFAEDWRGLWIGQKPVSFETAPLFRKEFTCLEKPIRTRMYICGLGYYHLTINGIIVGEQVLDPAQTDYEKRVFYTSHDVTALLQPGLNVIGVVLGNGMYNQNRVWLPGHLHGLNSPPSYGRVKLLCQLEMSCTDGHKEIITSDQSWQTAQGPIGKNNIYCGEEYNENLELPGWNIPGYLVKAQASEKKIPAAWFPSVITDGPGGVLKAQMIPPILRTHTFTPVSILQTDPGVWTIDAGQNISGRLRLLLHRDENHLSSIQIRFAETIYPDGRIDTRSTGVFATQSEQRDEYIFSNKACSGEKSESDSATICWEPYFTWHGFRYAEIRGLTSAPQAEDITIVVTATDVTTRGQFRCSNEMINRIHESAVWTIRTNLHGLPEDCPARERCGWLADAFIASDASMYNFDMAALYRKFLMDIETTRGDGMVFDIAPGKRRGGRGIPDWAAAAIILPWKVYEHYDDIDCLRQHYRMMKLVIEAFINTAGTSFILTGGRGDWCDPGVSCSPVHTSEALTTTALFFRCTGIMFRVAQLLELNTEAERYQCITQNIRAAFIREFWQENICSFGSQTAQTLALSLGLIPEGRESEAVKWLARDIVQHANHLTTGIFGLRSVFDILSSHGYGSTAIDALIQTDCPGFGNMILRGATTLWEYWGESEVDDHDGPRSLNHPMMACFDAWFYEGLCGIRPIAACPGFKEFLLAPQFVPGIEWAEANFESPYGRIQSMWKRITEQEECKNSKKEVSGEKIRWSFSVPQNTRAHVSFPEGCTCGKFEAGRPVVFDPGSYILDIQS